MKNLLLTSRITARTYIKSSVIACLILASAYPGYDESAKAKATSTANDLHEIIDMCMIGDRILKDYILVGMGVSYHDPKADLLLNVKLMDDDFADLENHHLRDGLEEEILALDKLWKAMEPILIDTPHKEGLSELRQHMEEFTIECEKIAEHVAADSGIAGEHYAVVIGELAMESQRMAALYMMKAWGAADDNYYQEVEEVLAEFEKFYNELQNADEKFVPAEIKEKLKVAEQHFLIFDIMAMSKSDRFVPTRAEKAASEIYDELREILELEQQTLEN